MVTSACGPPATKFSLLTRKRVKGFGVDFRISWQSPQVVLRNRGPLEVRGSAWFPPIAGGSFPSVTPYQENSIMVRTWLKQLNKNGFPKQRQGATGAWKPPSARLSVEALEKRELLSGGNTAGYSLSSAGVLFYQPPSGGIFALDTGVRDFCVPGSVRYDLHTDGRVFQIANGNL